MNSKQKLLNSAHKRMLKGMDFVDALYKSQKSLNMGEGVLSDCFMSLEVAVKGLTEKRHRVTLCQYIDSKDYSNELLFEEASKDVLALEKDRAAKEEYKKVLAK